MSTFLAVDIKNSYFANQPNAAVAAANPGKLLSTFIPNAIIVAGLIFLFMTVLAGFRIIVGAGKQQSSQDAAKAKAALTWSVVGFLIVVLGYFILQIVGAFIGINLASNWI
jgi:hypothetical protein